MGNNMIKLIASKSQRINEKGKFFQCVNRFTTHLSLWQLQTFVSPFHVNSICQQFIFPYTFKCLLDTYDRIHNCRIIHYQLFNVKNIANYLN